MNETDALKNAKQEAERARRRLAATASELQQRLKPGVLAGNAWAGVKGKSGELADDAVEAVRARPVVVSAALAAFTLFLARRPIKAGLSVLLSDDVADEDLVTARLNRGEENYDLTAPVAVRREKEGVET